MCPFITLSFHHMCRLTTLSPYPRCLLTTGVHSSPVSYHHRFISTQVSSPRRCPIIIGFSPQVSSPRMCPHHAGVLSMQCPLITSILSTQSPLITGVLAFQSLLPHSHKYIYLVLMITQISLYSLLIRYIRYIEVPGKTFNRGLDRNIGFIESVRLDPHHDCTIFHDVDLLPLHEANMYTCPDQPRHVCVAVNYINNFM
jgi:hypothetical protein